MHNNVYLSSRQQQYVDVLIPYAIRNKLNVGFARLAKKIDSRLRHILTGEVHRRLAPATQGVDISFFAKYPTTTINIGKFDLELDKIGEIVLKQELKRYNQKYTVGVQEALTDTERYDRVYRKDLRENIGQAFQINSVSYQDLDYGVDTSLKPNFLVNVPQLSETESLEILSFHDDKIDVIVSKPVALAIGAPLSINIPSSFFTNSEEIKLKAILSAKTVMQERGVIVVTCTLISEQPEMSVNSFKTAISRFSVTYPMAKAQEVPRTAHMVMRDIVTANSPWLNIFCHKEGRHLKPNAAIMTEANEPLYDAVIKRNLLSDPSVFKRICRELMLTSECYIFAIGFDNSDQYQYIATLNELLKTNLLIRFMGIGRQRKRISVFQCRQSLIDKNTLRYVVRSHSVSKASQSELALLYSCLYLREVTSDLDHLSDQFCDKPASLPSQFKVTNDDAQNLQILNISDLNNSEENRYSFENEVIIKTGFFSRIKGMSREVSEKHIVVSLESPLPFKLLGKDLTVSMPSVGISRSKFIIAFCSEDRQIIRLEILNKRTIKPIQTLIANNKGYFKERNLTQQKKEIYRCLWDVGVRLTPYISVLCRANQTNMLFQAFKKSSSNDYKAFNDNNKNFSLYGLLADKNATTPRSGLLASLMSGTSMTRSIAEWKVDDTQPYVQMRDIEYKQPKMKNEIVKLASNKTYSYTQLVSRRVSYNDQPMIDERYEKLASLDSKDAQKLRKRMKDITHVLYISSLSTLHKAFMVAQAKHKSVESSTSN